MPSAKVLESKQQMVATLTEKVKNSKAGVIVDYTGITVANDTALRKELREAGVEYTVVKNTLLKRIFNGAEIDVGDVFDGMTAIAISENDPLAAAKVICKYTEKVETFKVKAGYMDAASLTADEVTELSKTPSKEELLAKFLGSIQSPISGFARAIQAIVDKKNEEQTA